MPSSPIAITTEEAESLRGAAAMAFALIEQTSRGWSHPAVEAGPLAGAADRVLALAIDVSEDPAETRDDLVGLERVIRAIEQTQPDGSSLTLDHLYEVRLRLRRVLGLPPRLRPSPLAG